MGRDPIPVPIAIVLSVSTLLGFLTGLGVGGGSLLILWLTLVEGYSAPAARGINLLFFIPAALISCLFRKGQGALDPAKTWPAMAAGAVSAAVFSLIGTAVKPEMLRIPFGILLTVTGIREICYRDRNAR